MTLQRKGNLKHGYAKEGNKEALYCVLRTMLDRCYNEYSRTYYCYGGKGVYVCKEWIYYPNFRTWAFSNGYAPGLTLDRIDVNGNYEPSNCRWITQTENLRRTARAIIRDDGVIFRDTQEVAEHTTYRPGSVNSSINNKRPINRHYYYWYELQGPCLPPIIT